MSNGFPNSLPENAVQGLREFQTAVMNFLTEQHQAVTDATQSYLNGLNSGENRQQLKSSLGQSLDSIYAKADAESKAMTEAFFKKMEDLGRNDTQVEQMSIVGTVQNARQFFSGEIVKGISTIINGLKSDLESDKISGYVEAGFKQLSNGAASFFNSIL